MVDDLNRLCCLSNAVRGSPLQLEGPIPDVRLREDNKQKGMIKLFHASSRSPLHRAGNFKTQNGWIETRKVFTVGGLAAQLRSIVWDRTLRLTSN